jgi:hypothetical protein
MLEKRKKKTFVRFLVKFPKGGLRGFWAIFLEVA